VQKQHASSHETKLRAGIVGATGYTGQDICRLLASHPHISIDAVFSRQSEGAQVVDVSPHLTHISDLTYQVFNPASVSGLDVLFLAMPHGKSHAFMAELVGSNLKVVDLAADFRLSDPAVFKTYYGIDHQNIDLMGDFVLGFTELTRDALSTAQYCANPGCYATSVVLGLYPLSKAGKITSKVIIDAKSGVTGSGRSLKLGSLYCEANGNFSAYSTGRHRHQAEIAEVLGVSTFFSPHLSPMNRGILSSMYLDNPEGLSQTDVEDIYREVYKDEPFIQIFGESHNANTAQVAGSNNCAITIKVVDDKIAVFSAIDNLIKGSAGQAIQNLNVMCGFIETSGLEALALGL
jgi:N-acetyl-gamma-glutamyl-phosphate reductase